MGVRCLPGLVLLLAASAAGQSPLLLLEPREPVSDHLLPDSDRADITWMLAKQGLLQGDRRGHSLPSRRRA